MSEPNGTVESTIWRLAKGWCGDFVPCKHHILMAKIAAHKMIDLIEVELPDVNWKDQHLVEKIRKLRARIAAVPEK